MMEKKYQFFISSTYLDLKDERNDITRAVLNLDHIPAGMELFPAIDEEQFSFIRKVMDDCDYYVLILGGRYGSVGTDGIGFTEKEYDYAMEKSIKIIALLHGDVSSVALGKTDADTNLAVKLQAFRQKVSTGRLVRFWRDRPTLQAAFYESFTQTTSRYPATGWVRYDGRASPEMLIRIDDLRNENEKLRSEMKKLGAGLQSGLQLEDIDAGFNFRVEYSDGGGKGFQSTNLPWRQIFHLVASQLRGSKPRDALNTAVAGVLLDNPRWAYRAIDHRSWERILIQLTALGLIETMDRKRYDLTEYGLKLYTELTVIREGGHSIM